MGIEYTEIFKDQFFGLKINSLSLKEWLPTKIRMTKQKFLLPKIIFN